MDSDQKNVRKASDFKTDIAPDWCPGCGDFGILTSVQKALAEMSMDPWNTVVFAGIGCSGKTANWIKTYAVHTLHGRVLPFAIGAKMANPKLEVLAVGGDGDGYGIGVGHFIHAGRRNVDMAYIVFNNEVYGLTKGQASPTLDRDEKTKSLPLPNINEGVNPLAMALAAGYTFVARSYSFDMAHLTETIKAAIDHKGMALVDVLQPCPTYNDLHNREFFSGMVSVDGVKKPRTYKLKEIGYDGKVNDPANTAEVAKKKDDAFDQAMKIEDRIALGVFYQIEIPVFYNRIVKNIPGLSDKTPATFVIEDAKTHKPVTDLSLAYKDFLV